VVSWRGVRRDQDIHRFHEKAKSSQYAVAYFPLFSLLIVFPEHRFGGPF
jgi:hypothetical protein